MRMLRRFMVCLAAMLPLVPASAADKEPRLDKTGLKVGEGAPGFTLKDQAGKERSLDEFLKTGKVAIVFYRSAAW